MGKPLMVMIAATAAAVVLATSAAEEVDSGTSDGGHTYSGKVLLVSMDGFRWDYIKSVAGLTSFSRLSDTGCSVDFVHPAFATKTFPCHYTIATGLHEESHGILANRMYDPVRNASFSKRSTESFWWEGGEPIWVTAERQNKRSAVYFWPGSDAEIRGYRPSQYLVYNQSVPFPQRVETALGWLEHGGKDLVLLYFHEPDKTGHLYGPSSTQVADKVREMDGILGLIMKTMEEKKLDDVNLILTSDHGMTDVNAQHRLLNLWDYLDRDTVAMVPDSGTVTAILPVEGREAQVLSDARKIPHVTVYRKDEIPERLHYKHNPRVMPIIILSDEGWILSAKYDKVLAEDELGDHGFSNDLQSMKPIFFARGPDFRQGVNSKSIRSVDIYPLMCRLLNIQAAPNNGSLDNTAHFLVNRAESLRAVGHHVSWVGVAVFLVLTQWSCS